MHGNPCWIDVSTSDLTVTRPFYEELFGWTFTDTGDQTGHYHMIHAGDALVGGAMDVAGMSRPDGGPVPSEWGVFLAVDNIDDAVQRARAAGGRVLIDVCQAGDAGTFAVLSDPTGATISLWQAGDVRGFDVTGAPGSPMWFELMTHDYDAATAFYSTVFDFDPVHLPTDGSAARYATKGVDGEARYGICDASQWIPAAVGSYWQVYFTVDDCDVALNMIRQLGGVVLDVPLDPPFGRLATVADPTGAQFQVISW